MSKKTKKNWSQQLQHSKLLIFQNVQIIYQKKSKTNYSYFNKKDLAVGIKLYKH